MKNTSAFFPCRRRSPRCASLLSELLQQTISGILFLPFVALLCGCGGHTAPSNAQITVSPPDFSLQLSSTSLTLAQGTTTSALTVSVTPQNGFSGTIQVSLSGLPVGVASNPSSSFPLIAGASSPLILGASVNAATGNFTITVTGVSGSLSHSATLALAITQGVAANLPRTNFARTDAIPAQDNPSGEPLHRHIAYDSANKHIFVANRAMNRVEVFSSTDQSRVAQISVAGASSADLSADGFTVWIGTITEQAVAIDTTSLQVRARYVAPSISPTSGIVYDRPEELLAMASGKLMVRLRQSGGAQSLLVLWDPAANTTSNLTAQAPQMFQSGLGAMAHTGDRTKLFVAANDASGLSATFDSSGTLLAGPLALGAGTISAIAANPDGSRFAAEFVSSNITQLFLLDGSLNQLASPVTINALSLTFSRDSEFLFVNQSGASPSVSVFDASTLVLLGQAPDASIQGVHSEIEDVDETRLLFGVSNRGLSFIDASHAAALPSTAPCFASAPVAQPSEGPALGGTSVLISGQNFESTALLTFSSQVSGGVSVTGATQIKATAPASVVNGAGNIAAYFPSGWLALAPDAFSFGPQALKVLPNAGTKNGGDLVHIYGYGFGSDASSISVKIGGSAAAVQQVENVTSLATSLGLDTTYPFPLESITVQTPAGNPGTVDVVVTSPSGSTTLTNKFQYMQNEQVFAKAALYKFILYDQKRQFLYLSATDHVDVFDLNAGNFKSPLTIYCPSLMLPGPCPDAGLRGMALTPDGSQLLVADFGSQNVFLLNPDSPGTVSFASTGGVSGFSASGPARVAATSLQTAFVSMSGEGGSSSSVCASCLSQVNLAVSPPSIQTAPQPQVSGLAGAPLIQASASGNEVFLAYDAVAGGPVDIWTASSPNQFATSAATESTVDIAGAGDGTMFATRTSNATEIRGDDLILASSAVTAELEQIPSRVLVPGAALHPSGALIYQPFLTGPPPNAPPATGIQGGTDILDAHSGRLRMRVFLPEPLAMLSTDIDGLHGGFLAVDENGQRLFALTTSGLTIVQLANVPLGIGTVSPTTGSAAGGVALTIRGSGFQAGTNVMVGGKPATVRFKDMNTLTVITPATNSGPQQIIISNANGESVTLDAAFTAN